MRVSVAMYLSINVGNGNDHVSKVADRQQGGVRLGEQHRRSAHNPYSGSISRRAPGTSSCEGCVQMRMSNVGGRIAVSLGSLAGTARPLNGEFHDTWC